MTKDSQLTATSSPLRHRYKQSDLRVLAFKIEEQEYVVDVALVQEIVQPTDLMPITNVPHYVEGIIKRRDRIIPIINLRKRMGLPEQVNNDESWIIIAKMHIGPVGFRVDFTSELMWVKTNQFEAPSPVIATNDQAYLQGIAHLGDRILTMLNLEQLLPPQAEKMTRWKGETLFSGKVESGKTVKQQIQTHATHHLIVFELSGDFYGIPTTDILEIREVLPIMPLPHVPPYILGLINLRGAVLPVLDLRRKFNLNLKPQDYQSRLIIIKANNYSIAMWADRVKELARLPLASFQPPPSDMTALAAEYYAQVTTQNKQLLTELNVQKILNDTTLILNTPHSEQNTDGENP